MFSDCLRIFVLSAFSKLSGIPLGFPDQPAGRFVDVSKLFEKVISR